MTDGGLRRDPVSGRWSVIAPARRRRPFDASGEPPPCPFCEGNERLTPPEIEALRPAGGPADGPGWTIRVVPNKYPVFDGGHEVVVHTPRHEARLHDLSEAEIAAVLAVCRRRLAAHAGAGAAATLVIVNEGHGAGASLAHPHAQVFALPIVPRSLVDEAGNFALYETKHDGCLLCDVVARTRAEGTRLVFDGDVVAWAPEASRWPYEVWLAPSTHEPDFGAGGDPAALAPALKRLLTAVTRVTDGAPLNWWLHSRPHDSRTCFHWHVEIAPRTTAIAGFELATDIGIDIVAPQQAAAELRAALPAAG